jgi:hypothetical protein
MVEDTGIANVAAIKGAEEVCPCCKREDANILLPYERLDGFGIFFLDLREVMVSLPQVEG